jgi:uncharacterized protein (UPF0333 family)
MDSRGQLSAEYLLLVLVILIIMGAVSIPLIGNSVSSTMDVSGASDIKNAVSNIANAANLVYANGPGSKRTINIYTPQGTISADNNLKIIGMNTTFSNGTTKFISANTNYNVNIVNPNVSKGWHNVTVEWVLNNPYITIKLP